MRNNFFDNIYDFIAKKCRHIFAIIGFSAAGGAILLSFIGGLTATDGREFIYYFIDLLFEGALLAGVVLGYFKRNRRLLFGSFIAFFTILFAETCVSSFFGMSGLKDAQGAYIANWVFQLLYGIVVGAYLVFMVLVYLFNFKGLEKVLHYVYLGIFPFGLLAWILGIVAAANVDYINWTAAIIPLLEAAAFLFFPAVLALGVMGSQEEKPAPAPAKQEEPVEPEVEEEPKE